MHTHKIGIADDIERFSEPDGGSDALLGRSKGRTKWWRSPVYDLDRPGFVRVGAREGRGGTALIWGPSDHVIACLRNVPDPVIICVSLDPRPNGLDTRVQWVRVDGQTLVRAEVDHHVGSQEVRITDLMGLRDEHEVIQLDDAAPVGKAGVAGEE